MDVPFRRRLRRRLYYGDKANLETPSLPLTDLSVEYFRDTVSQKLGHVGLDTASDLIKRNRVSPCSMVLSMIYAKRLKQRNKEYLDSMSSSDIFFISMMMASKYLYDEGVDEEVFNDEWADNTDQDIDDVNDMEMDFLKAIDWHLFVRPEEFDNAVVAIEKRLALQEGLKRGWFTYSELDVLADLQFMSGLWFQVAVECSKLATVLSAAYVTSLLSMLGSTYLAFQLAGPLSTATVAVLSLHVSPILMTNLETGRLPVLNNGINSDSVVQAKCNATFWSGSGLVQHSWDDGVGAVIPDNWQYLNPGEPEVKELCGGGDGWKEERDLKVSGEGLREGQAKKEAPKEFRKDDHPSQSSTSTLWSLLFFDSLLSQFWSVTSSPQRSETEAAKAMMSSRPLFCNRWQTRRRHRMSKTNQDLGHDSDLTDSNRSSHGSVDRMAFDERNLADRDNRIHDLTSKPNNPSSPHYETKPCVSNQGNIENSMIGLMNWYNSLLGSAPKHRWCSPEAKRPPHSYMYNLDITSTNGPTGDSKVFGEKAVLSSPLLSAPTVQIPVGFHTSIPYVVEAT